MSKLMLLALLGFVGLCSLAFARSDEEEQDIIDENLSEEDGPEKDAPIVEGEHDETKELKDLGIDQEDETPLATGKGLKLDAQAGCYCCAHRRRRRCRTCCITK